MALPKKKKMNVNDYHNAITFDNYKKVLQMAEGYQECYIPISIQAPLQRKFVAEAAKVHVDHGTFFNFVWMADKDIMYTYYDYIGYYTTRKLSLQEIADKFGGKLITSKIMEENTKNIVVRINKKLTEDGKLRIRLYRYSATRPELWDFKKNFETKEMTKDEIMKGRYSFRPFVLEEIDVISKVTGVDYSKRIMSDI